MVGKIFEEAKGLDIVFDIDPRNSDDVEMRPSIYKNKYNSYVVTGRITINPNIFKPYHLSCDEHMSELLFIAFHELAHLKQLIYLNDHKIDNKLKLTCLKEFVIIFIGNVEAFYDKYHDSFEVEKMANKYAYLKTTSIYKNSNFSKDEISKIIKFLDGMYMELKSNTILSDRILEQNFKKSINSDRKLTKDLSLYIPKLKEYI